MMKLGCTCDQLEALFRVRSACLLPGHSFTTGILVARGFRNVNHGSFF